MNLTWENAKVANGPRLVRWLEQNGVPTPASPCNAWRAGSQATLASIDRILTRHGLHLWMVPDDLWEPPRPRGGRARVDARKRRQVLAAYRELGSKKGAADTAGVPVSTARYIIEREREAA